MVIDANCCAISPQFAHISYPEQKIRDFVFLSRRINISAYRLGVNNNTSKLGPTVNITILLTSCVRAMSIERGGRNKSLRNCYNVYNSLNATLNYSFRLN